MKKSSISNTIKDLKKLVKNLSKLEESVKSFKPVHQNLVDDYLEDEKYEGFKMWW